MSTFLEICNAVNNKVGLQGSISDVTNPKGLQRNIVESVRDAWLDIQRDRKDWTFLYGENTLFSTTADQVTYTPTEVFGSASAAEDLSQYLKNNGIFYSYRPLSFIPYEYVPYKDNTVGGEPLWYSFNDLNNNLILNRPSDSYSLVIRYRRSIQNLSVNTDEPIMHEDYHNAIEYAAIRDFANIIGNSGLAELYRIKANKALSEVRKRYISKKDVNLKGGIA